MTKTFTTITALAVFAFSFAGLAAVQAPEAKAKTSSTKAGYPVGPTSNKRKEIAEIIYKTGVKLGASDKAILAAFEAALVETDMRNLPYGHGDSVGVFQQRPGAGWGKRRKLLNVTYAATAFFKGNPSASNPKGAIKYAKKDGIKAHQVAQRVQVSAFPERYKQAAKEAKRWIANIS